MKFTPKTRLLPRPNFQTLRYNSNGPSALSRRCNCLVLAAHADAIHSNAAARACLCVTDRMDTPSLLSCFSYRVTSGCHTGKKSPFLSAASQLHPLTWWILVFITFGVKKKETNLCWADSCLLAALEGKRAVPVQKRRALLPKRNGVFSSLWGRNRKKGKVHASPSSTVLL